MIKFVNVTESCHRWKLSSVDFKYVVPYSAISNYLLACSFIETVSHLFYTDKIYFDGYTQLVTL